MLKRMLKSEKINKVCAWLLALFVVLAYVISTDAGVKTVHAEGGVNTVKLTIVDEDGNLLDGAEFYVVDENDADFGDWLEFNGEDYLVIDNLEADKKYTIIEDRAPDGYLPISSDITFTTDGADGITLSSGKNDAEVVDGAIRIKYKRTSVTIVKTDSAGNSISGAKFALVDGDNKKVYVDAFEDLTKSSYTLYNLSCGSKYTLIEEQAPDGYIANTSQILFSINDNNEVELEVTYEGVSASANTITIVNKEKTTTETTTEEVTTEEITTETITTEEITTETVTTESLTTDTDVTKSTSTNTSVATGDNSNPIYVAVLLFASL
ncbi:MAG: hypothetical protein IJ054_07185, partial [Lachnospiraceae bacterium]|nr:hypothetical protein [Lachnospiraceae bacterium]